MELIIQTKTGEMIYTKDILKVVKFSIDSPKYDTQYVKIDGRRGQLPTSHELTSRQINATLDIIGKEQYDYILKRDIVFNLLTSDDEFYVIDSRQPFKRWKVLTPGFTPDNISLSKGRFDITFDAFEGMAESTGTTQTPFTFESDSWGIGQNMIAEDLKYTFREREFRVYNAGDIEIDPREKDLLITFNGESRGLRITNLTTGDIWFYSGESKPTDTILIDRLYSRKNNTSIFGDTNYKSITLAKGWNDFRINGATSYFEIRYQFRFYYK